MSFWDRLQLIDRRWIFLVLAVAVGVPIKYPLHLKITPTSEAETFYKAIDRLPPGSVIMLSFDFGPSAAVEVQPVADAYMRQAFAKNLKVITLALWPDGQPLSESVADEAAKEYGKKYGEDYVTLGYKAGGVSVIAQLGENFHSAFTQDMKKNPVASLPLMQHVNTFQDIKLICPLVAGTSIDNWIAVAHGRYHADLVTATTAVMASDYYPYLQTKQLGGLLGGLKPAAEYQQLVMKQNPLTMIRKLDSQSLAHLTIIVFILIGNLGFLLRSKGKKAAAKPPER